LDRIHPEWRIAQLDGFDPTVTESLAWMELQTVPLNQDDPFLVDACSLLRSMLLLTLTVFYG
jgi:hypothetical protein